MFDPAYTLANGVTVQDVDMGVEYSYNGVTLSIIGEADCGEIHLNDVFVGYYEHNYEADSIDILAANDTVIETLECSDAAFDAFAAKMLRVGV